MKHFSFILILFVFSFTQYVNAQVIADSGYPGMIISDPNINMSNGVYTSNEWAHFDLDCDTIADMKIQLHKDVTAVDGANYAYLFVLNSNFEIIADSIGLVYRLTTFFESGDTLIPPIGASWSTDSAFTFGNYGCMGCPGPAVTTDKFVAYRNVITSQIGWINISINLNDGGTFLPVTLSIHKILSPCVSTSIETDTVLTGTCGVFSYSLLVTPTPCMEVCYGSIEVISISGGSGPVLYTTNGGAYSSSTLLSGLCYGMNMLSLVDSLGNSCSVSIDVPILPPISFTTSITNISCNGMNDGAICVFASGGEGTYIYSIDGGSTYMASSCFTGFPAGTYPICVAGPSGCLTCSTVVITEPDSITTFFNTTNISCNGFLDGTICTLTSGGTTPYMWAINGGPYSLTSCYAGLGMGGNTICAMDANGCIICSTVLITEPDTLSLTINTIPATCPTCCDGDLQIIASGGTAPYTTSYTLGTPALPNNYCTGNYSFCITDGNGCMVCDSVLITYSLEINTNENDLEIKLNPNPFTNYFSINSKTTEPKSIMVFTADGKIIFSNTFLTEQEIKITTDKWEGGIYFVKISVKESQVIHKLVKE